jgi:hypothetical protein
MKVAELVPAIKSVWLKAKSEELIADSYQLTSAATSARSLPAA